MAKTPKTRLDQLLVKKDLIESRAQAKALILAGKVLVNETCIDKVGALVADDAKIRLKEGPKYVSRGGLKLETALEAFKINCAQKVCLDIGASTGGFTDCLLKHDAKKVYALDVGYGQLHWKLQSDPRVVRIDRQNFRHFDIKLIPDPINIVVMDCSFISIKLLIPKIVELFTNQPTCQQRNLIALIKPQFEVGRQNVGKGGIVKDKTIREKVLEELKDFISLSGFKKIQTTNSSIKGADGNVEYLLGGEFF